MARYRAIAQGGTPDGIAALAGNMVQTNQLIEQVKTAWQKVAARQAVERADRHAGKHRR